MEFIWMIEDNDIVKLTSFFDKYKNNSFVKYRKGKNIDKKRAPIDKNIFWRWMISCLSTTQQRSGPYSKVTKFITSEPFPLEYSVCSNNANLEILVQQTISNYGLRRGKQIGKEVVTNKYWLEKNGWTKILIKLKELENNPIKQIERECAEFMIDSLNGFGPKQARNLLQSLGLTIYEIPIDRRIIRWLNDFGYPIKLSSQGLSDRNFYNFILDSIQKLCDKSGIYPTLLDAAIFSSYDVNWPQDALIW